LNVAERANTKYSEDTLHHWHFAYCESKPEGLWR